MVSFEDSGPQVSQQTVLAFEQTLCAPLPDDYRDFLMKTNGGLPTPHVIDVGGDPTMTTDVQVFFRIGGSVKSSELQWNREVLADRLDEHLLPIACDSGGYLFCLVLSGTSRGAVVLWDTAQRSWPAAPSFTDFIRQLRRQ